jgi:hypothetical protein
VPNTKFEGGGDGHGYGDYTFLVKQAHPSHRGLYARAQLSPIDAQQPSEILGLAPPAVPAGVLRPAASGARAGSTYA